MGMKIIFYDKFYESAYAADNVLITCRLKAIMFSS